MARFLAINTKKVISGAEMTRKDNYEKSRIVSIKRSMDSCILTTPGVKEEAFSGTGPSAEGILKFLRHATPGRFLTTTKSLLTGSVPSELVHSFLFCVCVCLCLCGPFDYISFHKLSQQLSAFSLCSSGLISALFVVSNIHLFVNVSLRPDILLCA